MATVFMKWLETSPKDYERGIKILTLGRLQTLKEKIVRKYVRPDMRVLEIGCGTGGLAAMMAGAGASVTGIDASPMMLAEARKRITADGVQKSVNLKHMDAVLIGDRFAPASFDLIVSTLVFSELSPDEARYVLEACGKLLAPAGRLLIADEVIPEYLLSRFLFYMIRLPLVLLTWLLTRTSTRTLRNMDSMLAQSGFSARSTASYLNGSLVLYEALPVGEAHSENELPGNVSGRLRHRVTLVTLLRDFWGLFLRIIPPYPRVPLGLYALGHPHAGSPVLVTGNFDLTVRRLVKAIDGQVDAWLLVADSKGINVWCGAGGGYFTAECVIAAVKTSRVEDVVDHRVLILPQLCANGVDGGRVQEESGWGVRWGPVRAQDIPAYLDTDCKKTDTMRWVAFPLKDRLEMVTVTLGFYGLLILLPVLFFWRGMFWPVATSLVCLSYFYAVVHPWLPGRDGLLKSIPLTLIALAGLLVYTMVWHQLPAERLFNWSVGLTGLSVFVAAELQGMSPLMRGEQANWGWEAVIGVTLGLIYWLIPLALGWR